MAANRFPSAFWHKCMEYKSTFIFCVCQACRGRRYDAGTEVEDSVDSGYATAANSVRRIPIEADVLLAYSVVPGK